MSRLKRLLSDNKRLPSWYSLKAKHIGQNLEKVIVIIGSLPCYSFDTTDGRKKKAHAHLLEKMNSDKMAIDII